VANFRELVTNLDTTVRIDAPARKKIMAATASDSTNIQEHVDRLMGKIRAGGNLRHADR
jgi:hypothetical protein